MGGCVTPVAGVNPPPFVPPAPENLNLIPGDGTLTVTWLPSQTATGYQVNYSADGGNTWKIAAWWNATTSIILSGMDNATAYTVKVRGRNNRGDGPWTEPKTVAAWSEVSVSNLGENSSTVLGVGETNTNHELAAAFTTGGSNNGYTLKSVTARVARLFQEPTSLSMAIHTVSSDNPAAQATYTLTGTSPTAAGDVTYTCSGSCSLNAGTTYFLVLSGTGPSSGHYYEIWLTGSNNETNTPTGAGWTLANGTKRKDAGGNWFDYNYSLGDGDAAIMFKVTATAK